MTDEFAWLRAAAGSEGNAGELLGLAYEQEKAGNLRLAATAYDRAFGLAPEDEQIRQARVALLDRLAVSELGLRFRYVPAGTFRMGSESGDPDEQPVHPAELSEFWIAEAPLSWADYCRLMGWRPPPEGMPRPEPVPQPWRRFFGRSKREEEQWHFLLYNANKIRLQYCEDATVRADHDWHAHAPEQEWLRAGQPVSSRELFGEPEREDSHRPYTYTEKPVVCIPWQAIQELCALISTTRVEYRLPTEAEWEKAARGGRIDCRYPWGGELPSPDRCDFNRFEQFAILPSRRFPPNGYGLYAMSGGVWEWTSDWYDAGCYAESPRRDPQGPRTGEEKVLRGGSWADCSEAVTVSFRMSQKPDNFGTPNVGFRPCRVERGRRP